MRKIAWVLCAAVGFAPAVETAHALDLAQDPFGSPTFGPGGFERWSVSGPLYAIARTSDGYLWLGTANGLRRFDGVAFVGPPELAGEHCHRMIATRDGSLFIATGGGLVDRSAGGAAYPHAGSGRPGLYRFARGILTRIGARDGLPDDRVWALAEDSKGRVLIGTESGLFRWDNGVIKNLPLTGAALKTTVLALAANPDGELSVGTSRGLWSGRDDVLARTDLDMPVLALARAPDGSLWIATTTALIRHRKDQPPWTIKRERPILSLAARSDGGIWVGTEGGLYRIDESRPTDPLVRISGERWIVSLLADRDGYLWLGSRFGALMQVKEPPVRNVGSWEGFGADLAFSTLVDRTGHVWVTTNQGVSRIEPMVRLIDRKWVNYRDGIELPARMLRSIAEGRDGSIWIGSWQDGLLRFSDGRFSLFTVKDGLRSNAIRSLLVDRSGDLWVTWVHEPGISRYRGGALRPDAEFYDEARGTCPGRGLVLLGEGAEGRIWLGGDEGLGVVHGTSARCFTMRDGLRSNRVISAHEDPDGTVWLGAHGLVRFRGGRFAYLPPTLGLPADPDSPYGILPDGHGRLWMSSSTGVFRFDKGFLNRALGDTAVGPVVNPLIYNAEDGMRGQECSSWMEPGLAFDHLGRVWVATLAGLSVISPPEQLAPPRGATSIARVMVNGRATIPSAAPVVMPRGGGDIEVQFTAPSFIRPNRLRFSHHMDGLDDRWVDAGRKRTAQYQRVPPGRYVFRVAAFDTLGQATGAEARLAIVVPAHIYKTGGFIGLCVLLFAAMVFLLYRNRVRQIEARHHAVRAERVRIARDLHDTLGQAFASIGFLIDGGVRLAESDRLRDLLTQTRRIIDACHEKTRQSLWHIRGENDPSPSLHALLKRTAADFPAPADIRLDVTCPATPVPALLDHELGFIAREAISNAVRHAEATHIDVRANLDDRGLSLLIKDDGRGIPAPANLPPETGGGIGGIGIMGMRERASRVGGTLTIAGGSDGGTEVSLFIPRNELDKLSHGAGGSPA